MKLFSLPQPTFHQIKSYYVFSYGDIQKQTDICFQSASRMQFRASRNGGVQMFFLTPNKHVYWKIFSKFRKVLAVLQDHIIFNVSWGS